MGEATSFIPAYECSSPGAPIDCWIALWIPLLLLYIYRDAALLGLLEDPYYLIGGPVLYLV